MLSLSRHIQVRGARTHNLRDLDIDLPRGQLVVFVGVSGSGKSSLVFDTIAAESGYQLNETYPPFVRNRLPRWTRPDVDRIDGLSPVIVINQKRLGGNARSTVGTITDAYTYLRLLFSRIGEPYVGDSNLFSFNDPAGMCPTCSGLGETVTSAVDEFLDLDKSLEEGAIVLPGFGNGGYWYRQYADIGTFDAATPLRDWSIAEREALLYGGEAAARLGTQPPKDYEGVVERFERIYLRTGDNLSDAKRAVLSRFTRAVTCSECRGDRLHEAARSTSIDGLTIAAMSGMEIHDLAPVVGTIDQPGVAPVVEALVERLTALDQIGLGYLTLARPTTTLSGGESQRIKTVRHLGSSLIEMLYVFDEPTIGLHPHDVRSMTTLLQWLRDKGNTVLVVEHDPDVMAIADHIVEIGPDAGAQGGELVFEGSFDALREAQTPTASALHRRRRTAPPRRAPDGGYLVAEARRNNLQGVTVEIPAGVLTAITGVAGSGKSSLVEEMLDQHPATVIDQRAVTTNRRSSPLTYTGIAPSVRKLFARRSGTRSALFSANSEGGCVECRGLGIVYTDLAFMDGEETVCPECGGARFRPEALAHKVGGLTIADVEDLTVDEAMERLPTSGVTRPLRALQDVGLAYLRLGQPLSTLSGGECQRLKIAKEFSSSGEQDLYVLDEPTTGLHLSDIDTLLSTLDRLADSGATVVVVEHNVDVIRHADRVIDLGPGAGKHGGRVLYEGPPDGVRMCAESETGRALGR